jgi:alkylation response protein AidB-like acyl-CoA dehydrogenase
MQAVADIKRQTAAIGWVAEADRLGGEFAARAAQHDRDDSFVAENYQALKAQGFFTALVPAELGGRGADYGEMCRAIRRLATHCGSTALAFSMHSHLVATAAWRWRHQKAPTDGLLRRVAAENLILVSSGGSDWLMSAGTATKVDGGYRINARKIFSSGCPAGDLLMTSAVYEDPSAGATVLHFGVSLKAEGAKILDTWHAMGMRGTGSHDIELKDVFVPDAAIAARRPQGKWHPLYHAISMVAMPMIYAAYVGVAEGARSRALAVVRKRADTSHLAPMVGEMENSWGTAEMAFDHLVRIAESQVPGPETTGRIMIGRTVAGEAAIATVEQAMEVVGGGSFYRDLGLERAFRDVQGARFHPMPKTPERRYVGRLALGLDIDG